jgi:predicted GH43/DUF377 family glycosyl hydrolase
MSVSEIELHPDPERVLARFFVPGQEQVGPGESRAAPVLDRILALDEADVVSALRDVDQRFGNRHPGLHDIFRKHARRVMSSLDHAVVLSDERLLLLGAVFTHEYSIEAASLCNPSAVLHPDQPNDGTGDARFIMSVRGIGEGHRSSIGFRTGRVTPDGVVSIDRPVPFPETAAASPGLHRKSVWHAKLAERNDDGENAAFVLQDLDDIFDDASLTARLEALSADDATRRNSPTTINNFRRLAGSSYQVTFPSTLELSQRVLWPHSPAESHGMEDARFVRFTQDGGNADAATADAVNPGSTDDVTYYGTYTAFDGFNISQHLLTTKDFLTFEASPMGGAAAQGKGLALFPRKIGGRYAALSRSDRESNAIAFSDDLHCWDSSEPLQTPSETWEILQLGNCGSPIETEDGWIVLTHGVGPMRTYRLGVLLLDLDEPQYLLARSDGPILAPAPNHRDGYVPNVVYSCGGFAHNDLLVVPFGIADQTISVATISIRKLLGSLIVT